jgi:hypothetical protein
MYSRRVGGVNHWNSKDGAIWDVELDLPGADSPNESPEPVSCFSAA